MYKDTVFIICQLDPIFLSTWLQKPVLLFLDFELDAGGDIKSNKTSLLKKYLDSVLLISVRAPTGKEYRNFKTDVEEDIKKAPFFSRNYVDAKFKPQVCYNTGVPN